MSACLFTVAQLQAQAASANTSLQSGMQNIASAFTAFQSGITSAVSKYQACVNRYNIISCSGEALTIAINELINVSASVISQINEANFIFNQIIEISPTSTTQDAASQVNATIQSLQQRVQATDTQISNISNETSTCLSQVANNAAANATATAQNATTAG